MAPSSSLPSFLCEMSSRVDLHSSPSQKRCGEGRRADEEKGEKGEGGSSSRRMCADGVAKMGCGWKKGRNRWHNRMSGDPRAPIQ